MKKQKLKFLAEAMVAGSVFGWGVPGSDPLTYLKKEQEDSNASE